MALFFVKNSKHDKCHILRLLSELFLMYQTIRQDMSVIYLLLTISIIVAILFFIAFIYSVKTGQFDDSYTPSVRMLFDDELVKDKKEKSTKIKN